MAQKPMVLQTGKLNEQGFERSTRLKRYPLDVLSRPVGGGTVSLPLPRTGIAAGLYLEIRGAVAGTLTVPNALGMASILKRVRVSSQAGVDIFNVSGAGYHYILRDRLDSGYVDIAGDSNARAAVTATTHNLDMWLPFQLNPRDQAGLIALQNDDTLLTLSIDWETDAAVATGATVTAAAKPMIELFTAPIDSANLPNLKIIRSVIEDQQSVPAAGDFPYNWPRGEVTYVHTLHGLGIGAAGADAWSRMKVLLNEVDTIEDHTPNEEDRLFRRFCGRARPLGIFGWDGLASSGLGEFGLPRDVLNTKDITSLKTVVTATAAGTLFTVRDMLVNLYPAGG